MARKKQKGLSYFPFDINFFDDKKIEMINAEFGVKGENIAIRLLCSIYKNGYWDKYDDDTNLLIAKRVGNGVTSSLVSEVVNGLVRRSFFNKGVFDQFSVLTSKGIQERFFEAIERRKTVEIIPEIMLIDINATFSTQNVTLIPLNVALIGQNAGISTQTKLNKTKLNETKGDETIPPTTPPEEKPLEAEEKKESPPPSAPSPPNDISMTTVQECYEKYYRTEYDLTRDMLASGLGITNECYHEWVKAFCRHLIASGENGKIMADFVKHFKNWILKQPFKTGDPTKLYEQSGTTKNGQQADRHADYANDLAQRLRANNG